jgi:hypothetical protein
MMKSSSDKGRKIYIRRSVAHVVFDGKIYGTTKTLIALHRTVTVEKIASDGGKARIQVTQKVPHKKAIVETWRTVTF